MAKARAGVPGMLALVYVAAAAGLPDLKGQRDHDAGGGKVAAEEAARRLALVLAGAVQVGRVRRPVVSNSGGSLGACSSVRGVTAWPPTVALEPFQVMLAMSVSF